MDLGYSWAACTSKKTEYTSSILISQQRLQQLYTGNISIGASVYSVEYVRSEPGRGIATTTPRVFQRWTYG